jgi:hypothetical protein
MDKLRRAVDTHSGVFHCISIDNDALTKSVSFRHEFDPPVAFGIEIPTEKLKDFYDTFGNLLLYHEPTSGDAAFYIASPVQWGSLEGYFRLWIEGLDEDEEIELLPSWIDNCIVIGEIPESGNYLLIPLSGEKRGFVFEFEHDGFEFIERAPDIEQFVHQLLDPDASALSRMASHMRFVENEDQSTQWWITEMRDSRGNIVRTQA